MARYHLVAALLLAGASCTAPAAPPTPTPGPVAASAELGRADAAADLRFLVETIRDVHPAATDPAAAAHLGALADGLAAGLPERTSPAGLYPSAARVAAALGDAHTGVFPPEGPERLPLRFRWASDGLVVVGTDLTDLPAAPGDLVTRFAGRSPDALADALAGLFSSENRQWVRALAEERLRWPAVLDALGVKARRGVEVELLRADGTPARGTVHLAPATPDDPPRPWFGWRLEPEHDLGLFWLDRCRNTAEYRAAVDGFFDAARASGIGRIAIDVRANGGGDSTVVDPFMRRLPSAAARGYYGDVRASAQAVAQRGYPWYARLAFRFGSLARLFQSAHPWRPEGPPFDGRVFVLTSASTFSSGNWVAVVLQDAGMAEVVGEPTGNAPSSYGDPLRFRLPASGLAFSVSHKRWLRPDTSRDPADALTPDLLVPTTVADLRAGRDPQLDRLRGLAHPNRG
jgi:hypothetical protein